MSLFSHPDHPSLVRLVASGQEHVPCVLAARDTRGLVRLIADKNSKKLLRAHIIAPEGADSIQTAAVALKMGMTYEDLGEMILPTSQLSRG
jgi:mercuric reductase